MEYIFLLDEINKSSINQVSILLTGKEEGIEKNGIIDSLFAFITKNKEVFTKESVDDDIEISSKKQKTGKEIKKEVKQHIAKNNLSAAISILIEYFSDEKVNADELNELFIHSGKLEHLKAQKRIGVISNEDFVNSNSKLANNLLNFTDNSL